jgi:hypothetical protein
MNAKTVISTALVWTVVSVGAVRAQHGPVSPLDLPSGPPAGANGGANGATPATPLPGQTYTQSSWIRGDKYACCGEIGGDGPIQTELFFRVGPSIPLGNGTLVDNLQTGLYLGAGGKALFFDPSLSSAWTLEMGIANISNHSHSDPLGRTIPLSILVPQNPATPVTPFDSSGQLPPQRVVFGQNGVPGVTVRDLDRTYFDFGGGKDWYLWGAANSDGAKLRFGFDGGGRWGSAMAEFNEIRHRTDVIGGLWAAVHADVECPVCGCCVLEAGFRVEYGYTWSDILQIQNKSDVQDLNLLFNVGIRF